MTAAHPLEQFTTMELWAVLPALLEVHGQAEETSPWPRLVSGQDPGVAAANRVQILALAHGALSEAREALRWAVELPGAIQQSQNARIRRVLLAAWMDLRKAAHEAFREDAKAAGDVLILLAMRVAAAFIALSTGVRESWDLFFGFPPGLLVGAATVIGSVAAVAMLIYVLNPIGFVAAVATLGELVSAPGAAG